MEKTTYPTIPVGTPKTLIFWCGDPRIQEAVNLFIAEILELKYGEYLPITVLGGTSAFSEPLSLPKDFKYMRETVEFCLGAFKTIEKIVFINHEDCARYRALHERLGPRFLNGFRNLPERQRADLKRVGATAAQLASHRVEIERYYAGFANPEHTQLFFEKQ